MGLGVTGGCLSWFFVRIAARSYSLGIMKLIISAWTDSFYKNITLYMTQFWVRSFFFSPSDQENANSFTIQFSFFNNFSGQTSFESWTFSLYNVLFTVLPPLVIGIFDQFVSARILDRYPQLYILGQKNLFFTRTAFWQWVVNALFHSLVLFAFSIVLFWGDLKQSNGLDCGLWFWGTTLYLATLLTVLGKAALVSEYVQSYLSYPCWRTWFSDDKPFHFSIWTKYTAAAIPGSFVFTMLFLPLYAVVAPAIGFSLEYQNIVPRLWTDAVFYFTLILVPVVCLARDFVWK